MLKMVTKQELDDIRSQLGIDAVAEIEKVLMEELKRAEQLKDRSFKLKKIMNKIKNSTNE